TDITTKSGLSENYVVGSTANIPLNKIEENPFQPREDFDESSINELAKSIENQGLIQPNTVRKMGYDNYQLISGERRMRAAAVAGLTEIPAYIRIADDQQMLEMALVENIQRENLNAIEIAISYNRLLEECKLTQQGLSSRVGKNRTTITNYIRLLKLPAEIQIAIRDNKISMGHARAIISIDDPIYQISILHNIIDDDLSVRDVEKLVRDLSQLKLNTKAKEKRNDKLPEKYVEIKEKLGTKLNTKIELKRNNKGKGNIVIQFKSDAELDAIISILEK
ncbi:MAG: ParB/RepB/Spo0J family partition protein, partial [Saprospiraceae bacterium]|nr:ParB/RepB/Spo0J family partition protein [Saprospiraceae bacterium]